MPAPAAPIGSPGRIRGGRAGTSVAGAARGIEGVPHLDGAVCSPGCRAVL
jgi:hypothetical protein